MDAMFRARIPTQRSALRPEVRLPRTVFARLLDTTTAVHAAGLKSFGLLLAYGMMFPNQRVIGRRGLLRICV